MLAIRVHRKLGSLNIEGGPLPSTCRTPNIRTSRLPEIGLGVAPKDFQAAPPARPDTSDSDRWRFKQWAIPVHETRPVASLRDHLGSCGRQDERVLLRRSPSIFASAADKPHDRQCLLQGLPPSCPWFLGGGNQKGADAGTARCVLRILRSTRPQPCPFAESRMGSARAEKIRSPQTPPSGEVSEGSGEDARKKPFDQRQHINAGPWSEQSVGFSVAQR